MNRSKLSARASGALLVCLLAGAVTGQPTLTLNGRTAVTELMGSTLRISISGGAGQPAALLIDLDDGPVTIFGQSVAIGLTPALAVVPLGSLPPSGTLTFSVTLPASPSIHQATLYFVAAVASPMAPSGIAFSAGANVTIVDRNVELAGNSLSAYPFFEHVRAFNRRGTVDVAVDPTLYPFVQGQAADIWVVAAKKRSEWIADPSLIDVRGGPQAVTFTGSDIQGNTFTVDPGGLLPGPDESPGSGDTRIGVPYDVVVDLDRDGRFDAASDLIDGYDEVVHGLYVVRDTALGSTKTAPGQGPYAVTEILYSGGSFLGQDLYYPSAIASLGRLPLVVVSHGNGHNYQWYDHIGYHLASYGYIVMSHQNNTVPGSHTAAVTTLTNTDYLIANQATIGGGMLNGHVDASRIIWIGHSRGGDGVARAYDMLFTGFSGAFPSTVTPPVTFDVDDVVLVSSIAPVDFGGFAGEAPTLGGTGSGSHPHDATFHLWVGQADGDVNGCPLFGAQVLWYHLHERATHERQSTALYGVGHGDFHDGPTGSVASGPALIGRAETHMIMRAYLLPLLEHHVRGDVPSRDFLWRQYESFRAVGASTHPDAVANLMFQDDAASRKMVIDDFQDPKTSSPAVASSGAAVTMTVADFVEGRMFDAQNGFTWQENDPFNGFIMDDRLSAFRSDSFGCVFSVRERTTPDITYHLRRGQRDFRRFGYLSFRAAQGTRHPHTIAELGDATFTVTLEDGAGNRSSIEIGAYGGGIEEPYQRNSGPTCGVGIGWNSEFETIRIRLGDFLHNGSGLDLADVARLEFRFGTGFGSTQARLGLDEIELVVQ